MRLLTRQVVQTSLTAETTMDLGWFHFLGLALVWNDVDWMLRGAFLLIMRIKRTENKGFGQGLTTPVPLPLASCEVSNLEISEPFSCQKQR